MEKNFEYYLQLNYQINLHPLIEEDGGGWLAEHPELRGCSSDGETPEEAITNLKDAKIAWIKTALNRQHQIPLPSNQDNEDYSGKFTLRLPKFLHKELATAAKSDGISLNQYILTLVSLNFGKTVSKKDRFDATSVVNYIVYNDKPVETHFKKRFSEPLRHFQNTSNLWVNPDFETGGHRKW